MKNFFIFFHIVYFIGSFSLWQWRHYVLFDKTLTVAVAMHSDVISAAIHIALKFSLHVEVSC